jgi:hypothetical protein
MLFLSDHQYLNAVKQLTAQKSFIREDISIKFNEAEKMYDTQVGGNDHDDGDGNDDNGDGDDDDDDNNNDDTYNDDDDGGSGGGGEDNVNKY